MVPIISIHVSKPPIPFSTVDPLRTHFWRRRNPPRFRAAPISGDCRSKRRSQIQAKKQEQSQPRTLFPGGYKRPEIRVPNLVLELDSEEVLAGGEVLGSIDAAVSKWVGIVVLNGGAQGGGGRLYEAACLVRSVVRDRAYLMVNERVDIAAAVNASGVVLSDQGLPTIVARNTIMESKSDSVFLPLVARKVQTSDAALYASNSEGADFLIYCTNGAERVDEAVESLFENVKIPIFMVFTFNGKQTLLEEASKLLKSGASGLVVSLEEFRLLSGDLSMQSERTVLYFFRFNTIILIL